MLDSLPEGIPCPAIAIVRGCLAGREPVASLPYPLTGNIAQVYTNNAGVCIRLGPPVADGAQAPGAFLRFERGAMVWRGDTRMIYVIARDGAGLPVGSWASFPDEWDERQPAGGGAGPAPGQYIPQRGFGKVWRDNPEVRRLLGYAVTPTEEALTLIVQPFAAGLVVDGARGPSGQLNIFYPNGRCEWAMSIGFR